METTSYCASVHDSIALTPLTPSESVAQFDSRGFLHALSAAECAAPGTTRAHRFDGASSLAWADQRFWILAMALRDLFRLIIGGALDQIEQKTVREYGRLVDVVEHGDVESPAWYEAYLQKVEAWAEAYRRERQPVSIQEREALYDDCLLDALASEDELP
ncbi:MAG: hypothetical protein K6V36_12190 [Anaerolineae bacterium]|nr:hypothetical protein [Anaerolineae bacterium]